MWRRRSWKVVEGAAGVIGAALAGKATKMAMTKALGKEPSAPGTRGFRWKKALAWTAATGLAVALGQLAATGVAARAWKRATGRRPPGRR